MARRSLLKDVSISELMSMRDSGMSNAEIADSLGVSYATVLHAIGRQPSRAVMNNTSIATVEQEHEPEVISSVLADVDDMPVMPAPKSTLTVKSREVRLDGVVCMYEVSDTEKTVVLRQAIDDVDIPFDKLPLVIAELQEIYRKIENCEVW